MIKIGAIAGLVLAAAGVGTWVNSCSEERGPILPNYGVIVEGEVCRSAQPFADELVRAIDHFGLKTVVNLRGPNPGESWYDDEARICAQKGVTLVDHPMSARSLPSAELLEAITETLQTAETPMLIHCQAGADRTGAVAAIYRMLVLGHEKSEAITELSPAYLHFREFTPCMDTLAERYEPGEAWLAEYAETRDQIECVP